MQGKPCFTWQEKNENILRRLRPGFWWKTCSACPIHMKLWTPTQLFGFLNLKKKLDRHIRSPVPCVHVGLSVKVPTFPTSGLGFVKQSAHPPHLSDLYWGRHVTLRPCEVLLERLVCTCRWGKNGNSGRLYFLGLQSHCGLWLQPWN